MTINTPNPESTQYSSNQTKDLLQLLIEQMVDGGTLPVLSSDEVTELASDFEAHLVPNILEFFESR